MTQTLLFAQLRSGLDRHLAGQQEAQQQLSSGLRLQRAAQDPAAMAAAQRAKDQQARLDAQRHIADRLEPRLAQSETQLNQLGDVLMASRDAVIRLQNAGLSPDDRQILVQELYSGAERIAGIANVRDAQGGWLFAGTRTGPLFEALPAGGYAYNPPTVPSVVELGEQADTEFGIDATRLFLDAAEVEPLPQALTELADVVLAEPATPVEAAQRQADIEQGLRDLDSVLQRTFAARAELGLDLQDIDRFREQNELQSLNAESRLSAIQDTDVAEAAGQLARESANLEAARAVFSRLQGLSLFNFLR